MPLPALAIPSLISGGIGITQTIGGLFGRKDRPDYNIPSEVKSALMLAKLQVSNPNMPGYSQAMDQINLSESNLISAAQESGNPLEILAGIQGGSLSAKRDLAKNNAIDQKQDIANLQQQMAIMGKFQDREFDMNEFSPYMDSQRKKEDMLGAGLTNILGGVKSFSAMKNPKDKTSNNGLDLDMIFKAISAMGMT